MGAAAGSKTKEVARIPPSLLISPSLHHKYYPAIMLGGWYRWN